MLLAHYLLANDAYMSILDSINTPEDLKKVSEDSLIQLCQEIRQKIIDDCAENPGHLGSSLGVVELTVALHYILDTPHRPQRTIQNQTYLRRNQRFPEDIGK